MTPRSYIASRSGSSSPGSSCATRDSSLSPAIAASSAATDFSRPTNSGTMRWGKTTMSRSGRMGRNRVMNEYMGDPCPARNKARNIRQPPLALTVTCNRLEATMADDREKISTGPNDRPLNETIAGTGPGIPDEALAPGEELPDPPTDEQVEKIAEKLGAPTGQKDTL